MFDEKKALLELRANLKKAIGLLKLDSLTRSRELSLTTTKLEEASMWLGKHMTDMGIFKPYTDEEQSIN